jgi:O-antigen ligase
VLVSLSYSVDRAYSLGEIKNELGYSMMTFVAFFAVTRNEKHVKWMLLALAASALLLCAGALSSVFRLGRWDPDGWHGGIAAYATFLAAAVPAVVLLGFFYADFRLRCIAALLLLIMLAAGFYSGQRIVWVVLFFQVGVALFFLRKNLKISAARLTLIISLLTLSVLTVLFYIQLTRFSNYDWNVPTIKQTEIDRDDRTAFWPKVSARILEHPMSGAGFGRGIMNKAYRDLIPSNNQDLWHAHNVVLNYGLSMGVPGMLAIVFLFCSLGWQYWQFCKTREPRLRLLGACGIALVGGVFARNMVNDFFVRDEALLFWALNGLLLGWGQRQMAAGSGEIA